MKEFEIIKADIPVIVTNYEAVRAELEEVLERYKGFAVTEEKLSDAKTVQKEIAGMRRKVDEFRKEKKAELSKPIKDFEDLCKELVTLIESVEKPIKEGIAVYDDARRAEKRKAAEAIILEVIAEYSLADKYAGKLTVKDSWTNLTAKECDVRIEIEAWASLLQKDQNRETEMKLVIQKAIDTANGTITTQQIALTDFLYMIEREMPVTEIMEQIERRRLAIWNAEHPAPKETVQEEAAQMKPESEPQIESKALTSGSMYYWVRLLVRGDAMEMKRLVEFLNDGGYDYAAEEKGQSS